MKKLSEKHKRAVDCYFNNGMNKTQALIDAGYSEKYANKNIHSVFDRPEVKAYIDEKQKELSLDAKIDREYILKEYMELLESCKDEGLDGMGTIKDRTNWAKALAQITKMLGLDAPDKQEIEHKGIIINITPPTKKD